MKFYTNVHQYTCGIDLHARSLYVCILDAAGNPVVHKSIPAAPAALLKVIAPYRSDLVIGVECMFSWYWVADFCDAQGVAIDLDLSRIDFYDEQLGKLEWYLKQTAKSVDNNAIIRLKSIPGVGDILSLVILYEIHSIDRFERVQDFVSYCRLVKCKRESAGKSYGTGGAKIGNAYLRWAFGEAAVLFLRGNPPAQTWLAKKTQKYNKAKALTILAHKLGRAVFYMLKRQTLFNQDKFLATS